MGWIDERIERQLEQRRQKGSLRRLPAADAALEADVSVADQRQPSRRSPIDFSSNDYLGLSRDVEQQTLVERTIQVEQAGTRTQTPLGATGSRLLSGDAVHFNQLERRLARIHKGQDALLCNSGYDANVAVVSSIPGDCILYDEYVHNSLHMGMRLWQTASSHGTNGPRARITASFQHNNLQDLRHKLVHYSRALSSTRNASHIVILMESIYSMDGDIAPVAEMLDLAWEFNARVVVDEAHGLGVGLCAVQLRQGHDTTATCTTAVSVLAATQCETHPALAYAVYTFGKAAGCHGAVIICPQRAYKEYLVNFAYPIVYSTALPYHAVVTIQCAYTTMVNAKGCRLRQQLQGLIHLFQDELPRRLRHATSMHPTRSDSGIRYHPSHTAIQALIVPGNDACSEFCRRLFDQSRHTIRLYPIKSPTVPAGQERVRIVLHAHNTTAHVQALVQWIVETIVSLSPSSAYGGTAPSAARRSRL